MTEIHLDAVQIPMSNKQYTIRKILIPTAIAAVVTAIAFVALVKLTDDEYDETDTDTYNPNVF